MQSIGVMWSHASEVTHNDPFHGFGQSQKRGPVFLPDAHQNQRNCKRALSFVDLTPSGRTAIIPVTTEQLPHPEKWRESAL